MQAANHLPIKISAIRYAVILAVALCFTNTYAQNKPAKTVTVQKESVFEDLRNISVNQRESAALAIYRLNCRRIPAPAAMASLDDLTGLAQNLDDKKLECSVFEMKADYYSVNTGFNSISTSYYLKAINFAKQNKLIAEVGAYQHKTGMYYYIYKHNLEACRYFLQALDSFKIAGYANVPEIGTLFNQMAGFYYDLGDYDNARVYLKESLQYPVANLRTKINAINTVGLTYRNQGDYPKALKYLTSALELSKQNRDTAWIGISTGNIGSVLFMKGEYVAAVPYLTTDYELSKKYDEKLNSTYALLRLIKVNLIFGKYTEAAKQLKEVDFLLKGISSPLKAKIDLYDLKAQLDEHMGKLAESITYRKQMELAKDSLVTINNVTAVERFKLSFEIDDHHDQLEQLKRDAELDSFKRNAVIGFLILITIILLLIYNQRLLRAKKNQAMLRLEKELVDEELKSAEAGLILYTESLKRNNLAIEKFKKEILHLENKVTNKDEAEHLEKLMQAHIMTDTNWDEFKVLFQKVHSGFFQALKKNYPSLSATDTRIISLMKLQLSNREMANMLGITVEGIKKSKQRLRKKMELSPNAEMEEIIAAM